ncbi:MAG: ASCH domain-containing protein [Candidatus Delongbacteria bacterium]|jgi:predicted transcriptional regulator|nr:ASCH domain-containing protein [Candidatus Delongbacteria bacterium]
MKVLLSIKPEYANKIFAGTKKYEFRRSIFKNPDIKTIVVYSSSPVQKVIGEFEIERILNNSINDLWNITEQESGINKEFFFEYYKGKETGFAIKIKEPKKYEIPLDIKHDFNKTPPQSFVYIS